MIVAQGHFFVSTISDVVVCSLHFSLAVAGRLLNEAINSQQWNGFDPEIEPLQNVKSVINPQVS